MPKRKENCVKIDRKNLKGCKYQILPRALNYKQMEEIRIEVLAEIFEEAEKRLTEFKTN